MIISFDIDNTLIPYHDEFAVEQPRWCAKLWGVEKLRKGTTALFKTLEQQGHEIWIYTTSFRSSFQLKKTFWAYGLYPRRYINERINQRLLIRHGCRASKNPLLFGIDLHIDDSEGVKLEGARHGFAVIHLATDDKAWEKTVIDKVELFEKKRLYE